MRLLPSVAVALSLMLAATVAAAAPTTSKLDEIVASGALKVGTTGDYKPFSYQAPGSEGFEGLDIDLANDLAKALGVRLELVKTSWPTLMKDFEAGKFDMAMGGISITLDRQKKGYFSSPVMRDGKTPIALCANTDKYQTLEQIDQPGVRVIVNPGGTNEKFDRVHLKRAQIVVYQDNRMIFEQIVEGKADVMITDAVETRLQQKLHPQLCAVHPDAPFDFSEKAYLMQRDVALKLYVDQWLHRLRETGAYQAVYDKWLK